KGIVVATTQPKRGTRPGATRWAWPQRHPGSLRYQIKRGGLTTRGNPAWFTKRGYSFFCSCRGRLPINSSMTAEDLDPARLNSVREPTPLRQLDRTWVEQRPANTEPALAEQFWF